MPIITQDQIESLEYLFEEVRPTYSGRGMYGKTCVGVVVDSTTEVAPILFEEYKEAEGDDEYRALLDALLSTAPHTDSMGLSMIVYWPGVRVE